MSKADEEEARLARLVRRERDQVTRIKLRRKLERLRSERAQREAISL